MANTTEELIHQMYDSQLASTKEQLTNDFNTANSELDVQKQKNQKAADTNLNRTAVESQKAAVNDAEYYAAAGLTSGAKAQARIARENQLASNLTAIRTAQQEADAETERQRGLLSQEYAAAIRKAQADNDFQRAQALYEEAGRQDEILRQQRMTAAEILGAAGDFSMHGAAYGMTEDQIAGLKANRDQQEAEKAAAQKQAEQAAMAGILASMGDYSGYTGLYGITQEQVDGWQAKHNSEQEKETLDAAANLMAQAGDFSRLAAQLGLTEEEKSLLYSMYASETGGNTSTSGVTNTGGESVVEPSVSETQLFQNSTDYDNGTLRKDQIEKMQRYFGVENVDGLWGNQSAAAAGNRTAKEAWDYYQQQIEEQNPDNPDLDEIDAEPNFSALDNFFGVRLSEDDITALEKHGAIESREKDGRVYFEIKDRNKAKEFKIINDRMAIEVARNEENRGLLWDEMYKQNLVAIAAQNKYKDLQAKYEELAINTDFANTEEMAAIQSEIRSAYEDAQKQAAAYHELKEKYENWGRG